MENSSFIDQSSFSIPYRYKNNEIVISSDSRSVLVICPDESAIQQYKEDLSQAVELIFAHNFEETQQIIDQAININLIIIDIKPFLSILALIKHNQLYYDVPTVVLEDFNNTASVLSALNGGAFDVWVKPLNRDMLYFRATHILSFNSTFDSKTGLYTKDAFVSRATKILKGNPDKDFYIIRFDIENFKLYNYTFGIEDGDKLLRTIGEKARAFQTASSIFSRWEKDHFVGLVEETYLASKNIIHNFVYFKQTFHPEYHLMIRMGIYKIDDKSLSVLQMTDRAMLANIETKKDINCRYSFYNKKMLENQIEEQQIIDEMESALKSEQFVVYLQPQYNQKTMHIYGAEALVRWVHPERGIISPGVFIPLFEKNGFILELDRYIFKKVCQIQRTWIDEGIDIVPISVNLSRMEAQSETLCKDLLAILNEYHLSPKHVSLEITETAYMDNPYRVINLTKELQDAGFEIEIDDFGSGYSSLNTLKEIPVDVLKLDFKFLQDLDKSSRSTIILSSIIRMAHGMNMPIIAEGVETKEQADFLKSLGCYYIQGFYFDRPMPVEDFKSRLTNVKPDFLKNAQYKKDVSKNFKGDFSTIVNNYLDASAILEYDNHRIECVRYNDAFIKLFDINATDYQAFQLDISSSFDEDNYKVYLAAMQKAIDTNEETECETQILPMKGRKHPTWAKTKFTFLFDRQHINTILIKVEDITQQKNDEEKIRKLNSKYFALADSIPGGIIDLEYSNERIKFIEANEQMAIMLGFTKDEFNKKMKKNAFAFVYSDDVDLLKQSIYEVFKSDSQFINKDFRCVRKNGETMNVWLHCKINTKPDGTKFATVVIMDSGENKRNQKAILSLEKRLAELKAKFALIEDKSKNKKNAKQKLLEIAESQTQQDATLCNNKTAGFNFAQEKMNFGFFKYNHITDRAIYLSDSVANIFGYTREEFYRKFDDSIRHACWKEDLPHFLKVYRENEKKGIREFFVEYRIQTKNGELKWVRSTVKKITESNGSEYYIGIVADINKEKQIEEKINSQDFIISALSTNLDCAMMRYRILGNKWTVDYVSDKTHIMLGYKKAELDKILKENSFALVHPEDLKKVQDQTFNTKVNQSSSTVTFRIQKADGTYMCMKSKGTFYGKQKDGYFVVAAYNITDEINYQRQLKIEKQRLQHIIDALPGGVVQYEIRPDKLKVLNVSERVSKMFGRTREKFILDVEKSNDLGIVPQDAPHVVKAIKELEKNGTPFCVNFRVQHMDGYLVWANVRALKTGDINGNPTFIALYQDMTNFSDTLNQILAKTNLTFVTYQKDTKELLFANEHAEILAQKIFNIFEPPTVQEFFANVGFEEIYAEMDENIDSEERELTKDGKKYFLRRVRVMWNGIDSIFVSVESI